MALSHGTRLGPYEVLDLLGSGGMGSVFRARAQPPSQRNSLAELPVLSFRPSTATPKALSSTQRGHRGSPPLAWRIQKYSMALPSGHASLLWCTRSPYRAEYQGFRFMMPSKV
jgi:hypothetical protein